MSVADESDHISHTGLMAHMFRDDLVKRVRVRIGVSNKAPVVVVMVPAEPHFRIEREMVSVLFQRLHVIAECVVRTIALRKDVREKAVAHADTEKPFDISLCSGGSILPETLQ